MPPGVTNKFTDRALPRGHVIDRPRSLLVVPQPFADESPASWVMRVCLKHAVSFPELSASLGIRATHDPDTRLPSDHFCHIGAHTAVSPARLAELSMVFHAVRALPRLRQLLRVDDAGRPTYAVCALCISTDPVPYFRIAWRFTDWNVCPRHAVKLHNRCQTCGSYIPAIVRSGSRALSGGKDGISRCQICKHRLYSTEPENQSHVEPVHARTLSAQSAVVAAVLNGYFRVDGFNRRLGLDFYLWLRDHYAWSGERVGVFDESVDAKLVSTVIRRLLKIYERAGAPVPLRVAAT